MRIIEDLLDKRNSTKINLENQISNMAFCKEYFQCDCNNCGVGNCVCDCSDGDGFFKEVNQWISK